MKLVIDISEDVYTRLFDNGIQDNEIATDDICEMARSLRLGTPLPKGHGRIIDENKITKYEQIGLIIKDGNITRCLKTDAPTIIERDHRKRGAEMKEILDIIHKTIYQFFDTCEDGEEVPMSDKDKLLLEVNKAICNNLKVLEQESKWIPVSERLPEIHQDVLLSLRSLDVVVGFRAVTEPYFYCQGDYIEPQNVLAWMPKPEPYKEESEDKHE